VFRAVTILTIVLAVGFSRGTIAGHIEARSLSFTLPIPSTEVISVAGGVEVRSGGYRPRGDLGDPAIPQHTFRIILPAAVVDESVQVSIQNITASQQSSEPVVPLQLYSDDPDSQERDDGLPLTGGTNMAIYAASGFYPTSFLTGRNLSSSRGWRILDVYVASVRMNAESGTLAIAESIDISVGFNEWKTDGDNDMTVYAAHPVYANTDFISSVVTKQSLQNLLALQDAYAPFVQFAESSVSVPNYDYLIVTAEEIFNERFDNGLWDFIVHKQNYGYHPATITVETIYSLMSGNTYLGDIYNQRAQMIRDYIETFYQNHGIEYVLLVGNPDQKANLTKAHDPDPAGVPMLRCVTGSANSYTDAFYADLFKSWDTDSDGNFGESWSAPGTPDLEVGRIAPVGGYVDSIRINGVTNIVARTNKLKRIFHKMALYDLEIDKSRRYGVLLPGSYMFGSAGDPPGDFMDTVDYRISVQGGASFWSHRLYQDGGRYGLTDAWHDGVPSPEATADLVGGMPNALTAYWGSNSYGLVSWYGHGFYDQVEVSKYDMREGDMMNVDWVWDNPLDLSAYIESSACLNLEPGTDSYSSFDLDGQQERWANLATMLHYNRAVAISANTANGYSITNAGYSATPQVGDVFYMQRDILGRISGGASFGAALRGTRDDAQSTYSSDNKWILKNFLRRNLLGDPSQKLFESIPADDSYEDNDTFVSPATIFNGYLTYGAGSCTMAATNWIRGALAADTDIYKLERLGSGEKKIHVYIYPDLTYEAGCDDLLSDITVRVFDENYHAVTMTEYNDWVDVNDGRRCRLLWWPSGTSGVDTSTFYVWLHPGPFAQEYDLKVYLGGDYVSDIRPTLFTFGCLTR
jgi:hypothetical protein